MDERKLAVKRTAEEACSEMLENMALTHGRVVSNAVMAMFGVLQLYVTLEHIAHLVGGPLDGQAGLMASANVGRRQVLEGIGGMMDDSDAAAALRLALVMLRVRNDAQASIDKMPDGDQ